MYLKGAGFMGLNGRQRMAGAALRKVWKGSLERVKIFLERQNVIFTGRPKPQRYTRVKQWLTMLIIFPA